MSSVPRIVERYPNFVDLAFHNKAGVQAYRVGTANTLDTAYAGVTALFDVTRTPRSVPRRSAGVG